MIKNLQFTKEINLIFASIFLFAMAIGIDLVTFPAILNENNINSAQIGIISIFEICGGIFASLILSKFVAKSGLQKTMAIAAISYGICILSIYFYQGFFLWLAFVFLMGFCWFLYVITRQAWFNMMLSDEQRGIANGVFSASISLGLASGPAIVKFSGATNYTSFIISAAIVLVSYLLISKIKVEKTMNLCDKKISLKEFYSQNSQCFVGRFCLDFQTYFLLVFTVIYGVKINLSYETAGLLLIAYMISGFFDIMVGFILKKANPYKIMNIGFIIAPLSFFTILFFNKSYPALLILFFTFGLGIACIYVSVFKLANESFSKEKLVAANSTFQIIGSIASLCGGFFGGLAISYFGATGFPLTIIFINLVYLGFVLFLRKI